MEFDPGWAAFLVVLEFCPVPDPEGHLALPRVTLEMVVYGLLADTILIR